jgi:hypothetical protein
MKTKSLSCFALYIGGGALAITSGCVVTPDGRVSFAPVVAVPHVTVALAPTPVEPAMNPDDYEPGS